MRDSAHEKLFPLLQDPIPEVCLKKMWMDSRFVTCCFWLAGEGLDGVLFGHIPGKHHREGRPRHQNRQHRRFFPSLDASRREPNR